MASIDGKRMKEIRTDKGMSLRLLSAVVSEKSKTPISAQALAQAESEKSDPSLEKTIAIAAALGCSLADIIHANE